MCKETFYVDDYGFGETGRDAFRFLYEFGALIDVNGNRNPQKIYVVDEHMDELKGDFLMKLKVINILVILIILFNSCIVFADLEDDKEQINIREIKEELVETAKTLNNEPKLNSRVALVYDRSSGRVLYEKNGNKQTPMASTTKIMTAIVVMENSNLSDIVTIDSKSAGTGGSRLGLKKNDKITVNDLLYGLMLRSGNDSAVALAIHIGGSIEGFAEMMNQKAKELKLINTHFVVPHGLDKEGHYTTAYELAKIADYALKIDKIKEIVSTKTCTISINNKPKIITNTNELLGSVNGVYGVKTGFTNGAGRCLVSSCKRNNLDIITVVIGADTKKYRTVDSIKLIEYTYKNYKMIDIKNKVKEQFSTWQKINQQRFIINKGEKSTIDLKMQEINYDKIAIKNTQVDNIHIEINVVYNLEAPVGENQIIGNMKIMLGNEVIEVLDIYSKETIEKKNVKNHFMEFLKVF